ncbi:MAG: outer membrane beta-barrel protein [Dehalococcoidia bacterium]
MYKKGPWIWGAMALLAMAVIMGYAEFAFAQRAPVSKVHPGVSPAARGFRVGQLRIHPALSLKEEYESNVFQSATDEQDDFLTTIVPGLALAIPIGRHHFIGGYRAEFLKFADHSNQDTTHHIATLGMSLDFPGGLLVKLDNQFKRTSEPPASDLTGRVESFQNSLVSGVEYGLADRYSVGLNYSLGFIDFEARDFEFLDRLENRIGLTGFYRVFPKTSLLLDYAYGRIDHISDTERDSTSHFIQAGVRGDLTAKLTTLFKIGWQIRESDEPGRRGFSGLVTSGTWIFEMTPRTTWTLLTERRLVESSFANNDFFESLIGTIGLDHAFGPKLSLKANVTVGLNNYPRKATVGTKTDDRNDLLLGVVGGLRYDFRRWLWVSIDYSFNRRDSNFGVFDYDDHRSSISIHLAI